MERAKVTHTAACLKAFKIQCLLAISHQAHLENMLKPISFPSRQIQIFFIIYRQTYVQCVHSTSVVLWDFISHLYSSLPLMPTFITVFGSALCPDKLIIFLYTHFWSCHLFFDEIYLCEWGSLDEEWCFL